MGTAATVGKNAARKTKKKHDHGRRALKNKPGAKKASCPMTTSKREIGRGPEKYVTAAFPTARGNQKFKSVRIVRHPSSDNGKRKKEKMQLQDKKEELRPRALEAERRRGEEGSLDGNPKRGGGPPLRGLHRKKGEIKA